jgi:hypothetical protein
MTDPRLRAALCLGVVALAAPTVQATPGAACAPCERGEKLIARLHLEALRGLAAELQATELVEPLAEAQYAHIVDLRARVPAASGLAALDDAQLADVSAALCASAAGPCDAPMQQAMRCLADRCAVALPPDAHPRDLVELPANCHNYSHPRVSALGLGVDWATGWQHSKYPTDGHAWSIGMEGRMRLGHHVGLVARVDRVAGRDAATDADGNGQDDVSTGSITRISGLVGPSFVFDNSRYLDSTRSLRIDLLGGYVSTRSQADESGPAAGIDIAEQLWGMRLGVRAVQGFGHARDATMVLVHIGFLTGSSPTYATETSCDPKPPKRSSRFAIGMDFPTGGYGLTKKLGYMAPGIGAEVLFHAAASFDLLARADLLLFPGDERDRVIHQAVMAGIRIDNSHHRHHSESTGFFTTIAGGYTHGAALVDSTVASGPVVDVALGWGLRDAEAGANLRLHGRFGVSPDNFDYRAIFISGGFELHFDPSKWRDWP